MGIPEDADVWGRLAGGATSELVLEMRRCGRTGNNGESSEVRVCLRNSWVRGQAGVRSGVSLTKTITTIS